MPGQRKLGMPTDQRRAMLRNQVTSFLENGKMTTTLTRAKETRSMAEKMIIETVDTQEFTSWVSVVVTQLRWQFLSWLTNQTNEKSQSSTAIFCILY